MASSGSITSPGTHSSAQGNVSQSSRRTKGISLKKHELEHLNRQELQALRTLLRRNVSFVQILNECEHKQRHTQTIPDSVELTEGQEPLRGEKTQQLTLNIWSTWMQDKASKLGKLSNDDTEGLQLVGLTEIQLYGTEYASSGASRVLPLSEKHLRTHSVRPNFDIAKMDPLERLCNGNFKTASRSDMWRIALASSEDMETVEEASQFPLVKLTLTVPADWCCRSLVIWNWNLSHGMDEALPVGISLRNGVKGLEISHNDTLVWRGTLVQGSGNASLNEGTSVALQDVKHTTHSHIPRSSNYPKHKNADSKIKEKIQKRLQRRLGKKLGKHEHPVSPSSTSCDSTLPEGGEHAPRYINDEDIYDRDNRVKGIYEPETTENETVSENGDENDLNSSRQAIARFDADHQGQVQRQESSQVRKHNRPNASFHEDAEEASHDEILQKQILNESFNMELFFRDQAEVEESLANLPTLPTGQVLSLLIESNWGDPNYVGLHGIESFSRDGSMIETCIDRQFQESIESYDRGNSLANDDDLETVIQHMSKSLLGNLAQRSGTGELPCIVAIRVRRLSRDNQHLTTCCDGHSVYRLVNQPHATCDDVHSWLAPLAGHIVIDIIYSNPTTLAMLRLWNYNKDRIHSYRGVRCVKTFLDGQEIFQGEIRKAQGCLPKEPLVCSESLLFSFDQQCIESIRNHDYENGYIRRKILSFDASITKERPPTAEVNTQFDLESSAFGDMFSKFYETEQGILRKRKVSPPPVAFEQVAQLDHGPDFGEDSLGSFRSVPSPPRGEASMDVSFSVRSAKPPPSPGNSSDDVIFRKEESAYGTYPVSCRFLELWLVDCWDTSSLMFGLEGMQLSFPDNEDQSGITASLLWNNDGETIEHDATEILDPLRPRADSLLLPHRDVNGDIRIGFTDEEVADDGLSCLCEGDYHPSKKVEIGQKVFVVDLGKKMSVSGLHIWNPHEESKAVRRLVCRLDGKVVDPIPFTPMVWIEAELHPSSLGSVPDVAIWTRLGHIGRSQWSSQDIYFVQDPCDNGIVRCSAARVSRLKKTWSSENMKFAEYVRELCSLSSAIEPVSFKFWQRLGVTAQGPYLIPSYVRPQEQCLFEAPVLPIVHLLKFRFLSTWGDGHYTGLDDIIIIAPNGKRIELEEKQIHAFPHSVNTQVAMDFQQACLTGDDQDKEFFRNYYNVPPSLETELSRSDSLIDASAKLPPLFDQRTPENFAADSRNQGVPWLAPYSTTSDNPNELSVLFDAPMCVSRIRIKNYSKTPRRGVRDFEIMCNGAMIYSGRLSMAESSHYSRDGGYQTVLFSNVFEDSHGECISKTEYGPPSPVAHIDNGVLVEGRLDRDPREVEETRPQTSYFHMP